MVRATLPLLAGALAALTLALLLEWTLPGGDAAPLAALRLARGSPRTKLIERAAADWARSILARPLFSASRRPPHVAAGSHDEAAPDSARLSGIMIGQFGRRAIFAPSGGGKPLVLAEGATVNESTIRSIEATRVVLASGQVLSPAFDRNRVPATYTPPFQPPVPNFPNQPFVNGNLPQGGFPPPRLPQFAPPPPDGEPAQPAGGDVQPGQPLPMFRGTIPRRE